MKKDPLLILQSNHKKTILDVVTIIRKALPSVGLSPDQTNKLINIVTPGLHELIGSSHTLCYNAVKWYCSDLAIGDQRKDKRKDQRKDQRKDKGEDRRKDVLGRIIFQKIDIYFNTEDPNERISRNVIKGILNAIRGRKLVGKDVLERAEKECKTFVKEYIKDGQIEWDNLITNKTVIEIQSMVLEELKRSLMSSARAKSIFMAYIRDGGFRNFDEKEYEKLVELLLSP